MICKCGRAARFVINGRSAKLQYWYCPQCKDIAQESSDADRVHEPFIRDVTFVFGLNWLCRISFEDGSVATIQHHSGVPYEVHLHYSNGNTYPITIDFHTCKIEYFDENNIKRLYADGYKTP